MYFQSFMSLHELGRDNAPTDPYRIVIYADKRPANEHMRRQNGPSCSEIAALIFGTEDGMIRKRSIFVRERVQDNSNRNEVLDKVSISHRSYDPLSYFMLFPNGTDGLHPELRFNARERQRKLGPRYSRAGACLRERMNSAWVFQAVGSSITIWWISSARWKLTGCSTCLIISRAFVLRTIQLFEICSETQEAEMMSRGHYSPDAWLCFLLLSLVGSGTCVRRCKALLQM